MNTKFSLDNVISKRICDREKGWIDFIPALTEKQIENFVALFGSGCRKETKESLFYAAKKQFQWNQKYRHPWACGIWGV